jgi:release factor glutamine methyltransferase
MIPPKAPENVPLLDCLKNGLEFLTSSSVPEPRISAETLLSYTLNRSHSSLYIDSDLMLEKKEREQFEALLKKRASRYPLQYLIKQIPFRNVMLQIGEGCLIPRPETEILVEVMLQTLDVDGDGTGTVATPLHILDIGTGSGNIAVSLACERPNWNVTATDISDEALKYAKINARINSVANRIRFIQTDLWEDIKNEKFDIIVSNPPYLTSEELKTLQPEVSFEPRLALDGGRDGLAFFKRIIQNAHAILSARGRIRQSFAPEDASVLRRSGGKPSGFVFFEVGLGEAEHVCELFEINGFQSIKLFKDDSQIDRIVSAQLIF